MKKLFTLLGLSLLALTSNAQTAVSLPGATDEVQATYDFDLTNGFTVEYRMYMHTLQNYNAGVTKGQGNLAGPIDTYVNSAGQFTVYIGDGVATNQINVGPLAAGQWYHIAITAAPGGACEVFIDGASAGTWTHPGLGNSANPLMIGDRHDNATNSNADYDNVRIWSGIRTATEISDYKDHCLTGDETDLEVLYQFETGTGTTVTDLATADGSQDGTIMGGGTWDTGFPCVGQCIVTEQTITQADYSAICSTSSPVTLSATQAGFYYTLRDDSDDSTIEGPLFADGSAMNFNTGNVTTTTTYNVLAEGNKTGLNFDGTSKYLNAPYIPEYSLTDFTVEAWVNTTQAAGGYHRVISKAVGGGQNYSLAINNGFAHIRFDGGSGNQAEGTTLINDGTWHHIAGVFDDAGNTISIYVDGVLEQQTPTTQTPFTGTEDLYIGRFSSGFTNYYQGEIDEARVWSVPRTIGEIAASMNTCLTGTEPGLVAYFPMNEGIGLVSTADNSINGNDAVMNSMIASDWIMGRDNCSCSAELTDMLTITINPIAEQTITQADYSACATADTIVTLASSESGINYYLRDDADDSILDGPVVGTGASIDLDAPAITATTSYNVIATSNLATALDFDGGDDVITLGNTLSSDLTGLTTFTAEANVNSANTTGLGIIAGNYNYPTNNNQMQFLIRRASSRYQFYLDDGTGYTGIQTALGVVTPGVWQHVAGTWDGTTIRLYVDGVELASDASMTGPGLPATANEVVLGDNSINESFAGSIDEVRVWNITRSPAEINAEMTNCLSGSETGLVALYGMNDGTGSSTVSDLTGNGYDGTLTNMDPATDWIVANICSNCELELADQLTITINALPTVDAGVDIELCDDGTDTLVNGSGADTYTWDNGITNNTTFSPSLGTTTYTVTGTVTATGCQNSDVMDVTVNALPTVNAGVDQTECENTMVTLTGTGTADTYAWDNSVIDATPFTSPNGTTQYIVTGEITLTGCENTDTVDVTINDAPTITNITDIQLCAGLTDTTLTAMGTGDTYTWDNGITNGVQFTAPAGLTTYTVTAEITATACQATDDVDISVGTLPTVDGGLDQTACEGTAITLTATGTGDTYDWNNGAADATPFIPAIGATEFIVTATITATGCTLTDTVDVLINPAPVFQANASETDICLGDSTQLFGSGTDIYTWSSGLNDMDYVSPSITTTYAVTGETLLGCTGVEAVTVTVHPALIIDAGLDTAICENTSYILTGSGGDSYTWDNGVTDGVAFTATTVGSTVYTVTGTNLIGCSSTDEVTITVIEAPVISAVVVHENLGSDGSIDLTITGGTGTYSFNWANAPNDEDIIGLTAQDYMVTVSDGNCSTDSTFTIVNVAGLSEDALAFNVYPNPTQGEVIVELTKDYKSAVLNITDAAGRLVYTNTVNNNKLILDLSNYEDGIYLMTLSTNEGNIVKRIVKQ